MTTTAQQAEAATAVTTWLAEFSAALAANDPAGAAALFTEDWIDFETSAGRGHGHVRLRGGQCWTLLTTLYELKGTSITPPATRARMLTRASGAWSSGLTTQRSPSAARCGRAAPM